MLDLGFYENIIKDPKSHKNLAVKILAAIICVFLAASLLSAAIVRNFPPVIFILALVFIALLLYLVFIFFSVEYEYSISDTCVSLAKIYAKTKRKEIFSAEPDEILMIAPNTEDNMKKALDYHPKTRFDIYEKKSQDNRWLVVLELSRGELALFVFDAPSGIEKILKKLKPSAMTFR